MKLGTLIAFMHAVYKIIKHALLHIVIVYFSLNSLTSFVLIENCPS